MSLPVLAAVALVAARGPVVVPQTEGLPPAPWQPPDLSRTSPRVELAFHEARGTAARGSVATCVSLPIDGWIDEAEPIALERATAMAAAAAERATGAAPRWRAVPSNGARRVDLEPEPGAATCGAAALSFGGRDGKVATACWAVGLGAPACDPRALRFDLDPRAPPPPTMAQRSLVAAVHSPRAAAAALCLACGALAAAYVRARPRPRVR